MLRKYQIFLFLLVLTLVMSTASAVAVAATFTRNLEYGNNGEDVRALQRFLNTHGFVVAKTGPGSPGNETSLFRDATKAAVIKFQTFYGIKPAIGFFGPITRAKLSSLSVSTPQAPAPALGSPTTPFLNNVVGVRIYASGRKVHPSATADTTAPTVSITAPINAATVTGSTVTLSANVADAGGIASVQFAVDGVNTGAAVTSAPYSIVWNSTGVSDGSHSITARATDVAGNSTVSSAVTVTVDNTGPTMSVTAPTNASTVSGSAVTLSATAVDTSGVSGVQFGIDGVDTGSADTSDPYSITWNSTGVSDGSHSITATGTDALGNTAVSSAVTVTVDNTGPVISSISSGTPGATSVTITWTTGEASDSQVNYGASSSYGATTTLNATMTTSHSVTISSLTIGATYHFRVRSTDAQGNLSVSSDQTVTMATMPTGALGLWYVNQFNSLSHPMIANSVSAVATSSNLLSAPRRMFTKANSWTSSSATITDSAATADDGTSDATTVVGTNNWVVAPAVADTLPAGTYTLAVSAKRNTGTDQQFAFYIANTATRSTAKTATSAWQRFSYTFTLASPSNTSVIGLGSIDGSTAGNIQIADFELYSGSSDLGPQSYGGHLYFGSSAYDTKPTYTSGAVNLSTGGYGLVQFPTSQTFANITVQALVSKVAAGSAYSSIFSKVQSYFTLAAATEISTVPDGYFNFSGPIGPAQSTGLWVALNKGYHVVTLRYDGTKFDYWLDDVLILTKTQTLASITAADMFVNITNTTNLYGGNKFAGAIGLWNTALTDAQVRSAVSVQQALAAQSSIEASSTSRVLVAEGDSITAGTGVSTYPYRFGPNANPGLYGVVYATTGSTITTMEGRATKVDGIIPPTTTDRTFILSVLIGANDLPTDGGSTASWLTQLAAYLDARRAAGYKVALCTVLPRTTGSFNTARNEVNAILRTWVGTHADAICDFAANATMGPDAAASNTTYYSDGTHPTAAGQVILETVYRSTINSM